MAAQLLPLQHEASFIDGKWVTGESWSLIDDPATGEGIGRVPELAAAEAQAAVAAARAAMPGWAARTAGDRARVLKQFFEVILANRSDLARLLGAEQGKPLAEAEAEIGYAASFVEWFAEEGKRAYGDVVPSHAADKRIVVLKQPVGVVAAITPWNFPASTVLRKVAPALAAGCAIVLKPAPQTPFTALALAALAQEAGLPDGLFSVVTGDALAIGKVLTGSPDVAKISFTGSTGVGIRLIEQSASTVKKLSMELGGNAPFLVFDDADVHAAVAGLMLAKFRNAGQTCICANRVLVQSGIHDRFVEEVGKAVAALRVGSAFEPGAEIGPLIDENAVRKVEAHISDAIGKGASVVTGGGRHERGGRFFQPTLITGATPDMVLAQEETFGPLCPVFRFETEREALELANGTPFGLASYFYTRDVSRVWRVSEALEFGIVGVNTAAVSNEMAPFGGVKSSGLGREGSHHGLEEYLETKYVCVGIEQADAA